MLVPMNHLPEEGTAVDSAALPTLKTTVHKENLPFREGEIILCKGDTEAEGWYVAEISKVLDLSIQVRYFHTPSPPLEEYTTQSPQEIEKRLSQAHFRRTWYIHGGGQSWQSHNDSSLSRQLGNSCLGRTNRQRRLGHHGSTQKRHCQ